MVLFVEEMAYFFHHRDGIYLIFGVLTQGNEFSKKLVHVGHIKVSGHDEVTAAPVALPEHRVAVFYLVGAVGAVAKVPQPKLTREGEILLQPAGVECAVFVIFESFAELLVDFLEDVCYRLRFNRSVPADVAFTGWYFNFNVGYSCSVLAPVYLFLHHD